MSLILYTAAEVADLLKMNHQVIQRKLAAGEIPAYRIGREWRVEHGALMEWLEQHSNRRLSTHEQLFRSFIGPDGRLTAIPAKRSKREVMLRWLIEKVEPGRTYSEKELNAVLREYHDDVAFLRRALVEMKLLVRTPAGIYRRPSALGSKARTEAEVSLRQDR